MSIFFTPSQSTTTTPADESNNTTSTTGESSSTSGANVSDSQAVSDSQTADTQAASDDESGSDGVDSSDDELTDETAQSNQAIVALLSMGSHLLGVTTDAALNNEWARANSTDGNSGSGVDTRLEGQVRIDSAVQDNSQWWVENHGGSMFSAIVAQGNANQSGLMAMPGGELLLQQGYFPV